jgi:tetratricopeptide (TPR) repeat protein
VDNSSEKSKVLVVYLILILIIFAVFGQVRNFKFLNYDDNSYVTENNHALTGLTLDNIAWAFKQSHSFMWHPITSISHMLDCQIFGLKAGGHHIVNLLFHIANTLLLFTVLRKMTGAFWQSAFVAAFFALHPLNVESVAWISERKNVLSAFFWMLTMAVYIRYAKQPRFANYLLVIFVFSLALMAKPVTVTLPFALLLLDYWPLNRLQIKNKQQIFRLVGEKIPLFLLSAVLCVITIAAQGGSDALQLNKLLPFSVRFENALVSYVSYIGKMIYPSHLSVFYPHPGPSLPLWEPIVSFVLLAAVSVAVLYLGRRKPYLIVGWFWYLGTLVPVIGLMQAGSQAMADRYAYIPLIGLFIIIAWGASDIFAGWKYRKIVLSLSAIVIISALSICTWIQTSYWGTSQTLFEHALKITTGNYVAYNCLGSALIEQDKFDEAIDMLHHCLQIKPNYGWAYNNLGIAYAKQNRYEEAIEACEQAIRIQPKNSWAYYTLGVSYDKLGRYREAMEAYKQAVTVEPYYADAYYNLGLAFAKLGRYQEAIQAYEQAIRIRPDDADAYCNLASAYGKLGQFQNEIEACKHALRINPELAEAYYNLGAAFGQLGRYPEAIEACKQAIRIRPDYAEAHYNLGAALMLAGDKNAAFEQYKILKSLNPNAAEQLLNLIKQ